MAGTNEAFSRVKIDAQHRQIVLKIVAQHTEAFGRAETTYAALLARAFGGDRVATEESKIAVA